MKLSFEQIKAAYDQEIKGLGPVRRKDDIPLSWDSITAEWLTDVLIGGGGDARVIGFRLDDEDEGTSSRRRIFLEYNEAGRGDRLPASVFCKSTQRLENRYIIGMNGGIEAEVTFYAKVRAGLDIEAPECLHARFNPQSLNSIMASSSFRNIEPGWSMPRRLVVRRTLRQAAPELLSAMPG